ncbi:hypothetical protein HMN09_01426700 [Mycena chlorophos]|uniref:Uncharacterized protein n=1 Tax=Mycena chlorophos TaxID=658473 RepID=A0A8H6VNT1_MYCCL|nr:hypothetical protein HMN09_01426700 [Mycena chlorophos]
MKPEIELGDYDVKISWKELAGLRESYAREQTLRLALAQQLETTNANVNELSAEREHLLAGVSVLEQRNDELSAKLEEAEIEQAELKNGLAILEGWVESSAKELALARAERDKAREMAVRASIEAVANANRDGTAVISKKTSDTASAEPSPVVTEEATLPAPEPGEWDPDPAINMIVALPLPQNWPDILKWQAVVGSTAQHDQSYRRFSRLRGQISAVETAALPHSVRH